MTKYPKTTEEEMEAERLLQAGSKELGLSITAPTV